MKVIVVGAGILGASAAYSLVRAGCAVTMVDRVDEGRATAAGAGIVSPWGSPTVDEDYYALLAHGARYYPRLVQMLAEDGEFDLGYAKVGGLYVASDPAELDAAERRARARAVDAPEAGSIERLAPADARRAFPPLREDQPGLFVSGGARVDGRRIAAAMQRAAAKRGARLVNGSAELVMRGGRAAGVRVNGELIEADAVVATAGAWAPKFLEPAGVRLAVAPQRGQIVHLRLPGTETAHWSILQPLNSYYLLAFEDSRVVIGASRETGSGFDYRLTAAGVAEVLNAGLTIAPGLAAWTLHEIRIGFRPLADDTRPKLGKAPGIDNLIIGNGLGPSGLTMGPFSGAELARLTLGKPTELALDAYAIGAG
ncbi:FAD-dependent oxidoreductase [Hyphomicrobium sp. CS1BSMeth3]|uniref:NAD(P)/FAD-dependent oxidoreductase n=1 Tax=Hyphomicrobium sp. CS1BSMeth3 TaxID=1892844 RepID=UPI000930287B|nr:FAD-dependent oxidoreductase [Hyphomicrobium sp. CS1BSMeth3]